MRSILLLFAVALASALQAAPPLAQPESGPTSTVPPAAADAGKDVVHQLNSAFTKVFEIVAPTVVIIEVTKKNDGGENSALDDLFFQGPQDDNAPRRGPRSTQPIQSEGSGFIVRADGFIYTNYHVLEGADRIDVKLKDGREFQAKIVGTDEKTDIAVIKIEATNLPVAQFANSDEVRVGQFAFAIGAPFKLDYTFTYGVISGKGRSKLIATGGYSISDYLQTDASINPGNSGGPLCDIDGKVVGMNTLINGLNRGLGFAIPSNLTNEIGQQLIAGHKIVRPWLGIRIESLGDDPSIRELFKGLDKGVVVRTIEADAPAYKSDLRPFDVITQVDGAAVTTDTQLAARDFEKEDRAERRADGLAKGTDAEDSGDDGRIAERHLARVERDQSAGAVESGRLEQVRAAGAGADEGSCGAFEARRDPGRDRDRRGRQQPGRGAGHPARRCDHGSGRPEDHEPGVVPRCVEQSRSAQRRAALSGSQRQQDLRGAEGGRVIFSQFLCSRFAMRSVSVSIAAQSRVAHRATATEDYLAAFARRYSPSGWPSR